MFTIVPVKQQEPNPISLDFVAWLHANFDALVEEAQRQQWREIIGEDGISRIVLP